MALAAILQTVLQLVLAGICAFYAYRGLRAGRFSLGVWSGKEHFAQKANEPRTYWFWVALCSALTVVLFALGISHFLVR